MNADDLRQMRGGFDDEAAGSQHVFRTTLDALSHPGRPLALDTAAQSPQAGHRAAALSLLALLDADCSLWLSPRLRQADAAAWLRFHTGARLVDDPAQALFLWVALGDAMPPLASLRQGSDSYPDQSATCVLEVDHLEAGGEWVLQGPGIPGERRLDARGLPAGFAAQWAANHATFPRGVDLLLATATHIAGLPRTTRLAMTQEA